jgi:hypothetical protein
LERDGRLATGRSAEHPFKFYILNPQDGAAKYAGQTVVVKGTTGGSETFTTMKGSHSGVIITAPSITRLKASDEVHTPGAKP